ncbi:MAG: response regulator [Deltaproteobacteria bacterium]|nr:response regulator [Deltaproteobacteria bacterium]
MKTSSKDEIEQRQRADPTGEEKSGNERRAHSRVVAELEVSFRSIDELVTAYSSDISEGGIYVPTIHLMPIAAVVTLNIVLPDAGPKLRAIARVAYVMDAEEAERLGRKPGMGFEFLDAGEKPMSEQIAEFINKRLGKVPARRVDGQIGASILLVDDTDSHLERSANAMKNAGYRVLSAKDGVEALSIAVRAKPDLIISDVQMPNMNGWHLLRLIRARPSLASIPFIFLTSLDSDQERLKGYQLGVDDYVNKPFVEAELLLRVKRVLERSRTQRGGAGNKALRGDLSHVSLASLLSLVEMERRTGHLLLIHEREIANLRLRNGAVIRIELDKKHQGKNTLEKFFHVLDWDLGQFELSAAEVTEDDIVGLPTSYIILEHARRRDEVGK